MGYKFQFVTLAGERSCLQLVALLHAAWCAARAAAAPACEQPLWQCKPHTFERAVQDQLITSPPPFPHPAGYHALNFSMFELALGYRDRGALRTLCRCFGLGLPCCFVAAVPLHCNAARDAARGVSAQAASVQLPCSSARCNGPTLPIPHPACLCPLRNHPQAWLPTPSCSRRSSPARRTATPVRAVLFVAAAVGGRAGTCGCSWGCRRAAGRLAPHAPGIRSISSLSRRLGVPQYNAAAECIAKCCTAMRAAAHLAAAPPPLPIPCPC